MALHSDDNTRGKSHSQGLPGLIFGVVFIGAAFIGAFVAGWMLAKSNLTPPPQNVIVPGLRLVADPHADFASPISVPSATVPEPPVPDVPVPVASIPHVVVESSRRSVSAVSPTFAAVESPRPPELPVGAELDSDPEPAVEPARLVINT